MNNIVDKKCQNCDKVFKINIIEGCDINENNFDIYCIDCLPEDLTIGIFWVYWEYNMEIIDSLNGMERFEKMIYMRDRHITNKLLIVPDLENHENGIDFIIPNYDCDIYTAYGQPFGPYRQFCSSCKHWEFNLNGSDDIINGICTCEINFVDEEDKICLNGSMVICDDSFCSNIMTGPLFGCVNFKHKKKQQEK